MPNEGVKVDPQKISSVKDWLRPTSATGIHNFLGLESYDQKFVEGFSSIAAPLTNLTQKTAKFQWPEACEKIFQELKRRWLELFKDYDLNILNHPGKVNVAADAFSLKSMGTLAYLHAQDMPIGREIQRLARLGVQLNETEDGELVGIPQARSDIVERIKSKQYKDGLLVKL
ncbi:uncharacterized protein LOC132627378 [Lycium barbarum]|uniref:uncharacterized protein LOC132627378 n=1 Tax=Lycium barbarum TaxID=112863 RepID=UPI00293EBF05|nr:uncharacterized protein LOC132627378 [Lycium barbarum]